MYAVSYTHLTIKSYSGATGDAESPRNIIDGDTNPRDIHNKWCNINSTHECVIDLQGDYRIYGFKIFDCKSGPESNENFGNYRIYLSEDGINWKLLVDEQGRERDNIKEDYIVPTTARYVKLNPYSCLLYTSNRWRTETGNQNCGDIPLPFTLITATFELKPKRREKK